MTSYRDLDPRHSLVAGTIWLVIGLATAFAAAASIWAGRVAREIVVQQHVRRLVLETDQLGSDLGQAVSARLLALRARSGGVPDAALFDGLSSTYSDLGWIAVIDHAGVVLAGDGTLRVGTSVADRSWFSRALAGPWIGVIEESRKSMRTPLLGDFAAPLKNPEGQVLGVVAAHLTWQWAESDVRRLSAALDPRGSAQTLVLDHTGLVVVGAQTLRGHPWTGTLIDESPPIEPAVGGAANLADAPRFEKLSDGQAVLVARAGARIVGVPTAESWQVQLSEPIAQVYQRANALAIRILWISAGLGMATACVGALGARHLTSRLKRLTRSAVAVGRNESERIEVPSGRDEVAQLAAAFAKILDDLRQERRELLKLSSELERRVAVRTREVERLAEESRYAAIVRERLKIARDLHDTLAHSMMAMLSEVRLLRKLQIHDPQAMAEELERAEQVARDGLNEARVAITQMRVNAVRDTGLGPALAKAFDRFVDHTGLTGAFTADPAAARFGDERAETLFRMAEEALRNIERHAMATRVDIALTMIGETHVRLRIADDGVGFDTADVRPGHYGLVGLREQAQLIDAELQIESGENRGTVVSATLRVMPEIL